MGTDVLPGDFLQAGPQMSPSWGSPSAHGYPARSGADVGLPEALGTEQAELWFNLAASNSAPDSRSFTPPRRNGHKVKLLG